MKRGLLSSPLVFVSWATADATRLRSVWGMHTRFSFRLGMSTGKPNHLMGPRVMPAVCMGACNAPLCNQQLAHAGWGVQAWHLPHSTSLSLHAHMPTMDCPDDCPVHVPAALIFVVDSQDRERVAKAAAEFQAIIQDPMMLNSVILVFANKQDMRGSLTPAEVCTALGLPEMRNRKWHVQSAVAIRGEGLYEGLDWLSSTAAARRPQ